MVAGERPEGIERRINSEIIIDKINIRRDKKPRYEVELDVPKLKFICRPAQFRGDSGRTMVELAYAVSLDDPEMEEKVKSHHTFNFQTDLVLLDSLKRRALHAHDQRQFVYLDEKDYNMHYIGEEKNEVQSGDYKMTFQVLETSVNRGDFKTESLDVRDFRGKDLMVSDLKFSRDAGYLGEEPGTKKELFSTQPYPFFEIKKNEPIYLYFEIYNLMMSPEERSRYRISLNVERKRTTGEFFALPITSIGKFFSRGELREIETVYTRDGESQTGVECINLDLSGLENGHSRLTVTVEDLLADEKVSNRIEFDLE